MWQEAGKLVWKGGKMYLQTRGIKGVIEDGKTVVDWTKKQLSSHSNQNKQNQKRKKRR